MMKDSWNRIWALIERDLRRFRRSPTLIVVSMILPLVQLVVLGYAFGGKIKNLELGVGARRTAQRDAQRCMVQCANL